MCNCVISGEKKQFPTVVLLFALSAIVRVATFVPHWRFEFCNDSKIIIFMNCVYAVVRIAGRWIQIYRPLSLSLSLFSATFLSVFASKHHCTARCMHKGGGTWGEGVRGGGARNTLIFLAHILSTPCYTVHHTKPRRLRQRHRRRHYLAAAAIVLLFAHSQSSQANRLTVWPGGCANHSCRPRIILYTHTLCVLTRTYCTIYSHKYINTYRTVYTVSYDVSAYYCDIHNIILCPRILYVWKR